MPEKLSKFTFRYKQGEENNYPLIPLKFSWKGKESPLIEGLLDSGSDQILIPRGLAKYLGLPLEKQKKSMRVAGGSRRWFKSKVDFAIGRGGREVTFKNRSIAVIDSDDCPVLVGRDPLFKEYEIIFREFNNQFILNPPKEKQITSKKRKS